MLRRPDDATATLVRLVAGGAAAFVDAHALAALLVAARVAGVAAIPWRLVLAPLFAASAVAALTQWRFLSRVATLRLVQPAPFGYGALQRGDAAATVIHEDAKPLARRGVVGVVASVPALALVVAAQVFVALAVDPRWRARRRMLRRSCVCAWVLQSGAVLAAGLLKGRSSDPAWREVEAARVRPGPYKWSGRLGATFQLLHWLALSCAVRALSGTGSRAKIGTVLAPLWASELLLVASLLVVARRHRKGVYRLDGAQLASAASYCAAAALAAAGQALLFERPGDGPARPAALLAAAAAAFGVPLRCALARHAAQLCASRGHCEPLPLARTAEGFWAPTGEKASFWFLLGSFRRVRRDPPPERYGERCAAACAATCETHCAPAVELRSSCCSSAGDDGDGTRTPMVPKRPPAEIRSSPLLLDAEEKSEEVRPQPAAAPADDEERRPDEERSSDDERRPSEAKSEERRPSEAKSESAAVS